jgi:very-short-patch-repair endonuclease
MRRDATPAERRLWQGLRRYQLEGWKFRRQMPLGQYIPDFYCAAAKVVVELNGISHIESPADDARDAWMQSQGILVLRFSNYEALSNAEGILLAIKEAAVARAAAQTRPPPPPNLLPRGEGESLSPSRAPSPRHLHV